MKKFLLKVISFIILLFLVLPLGFVVVPVMATVIGLVAFVRACYELAGQVARS